jgi:hypothetical protein
VNKREHLWHNEGVKYDDGGASAGYYYTVIQGLLSSQLVSQESVSIRSVDLMRRYLRDRGTSVHYFHAVEGIVS